MGSVEKTIKLLSLKAYLNWLSKISFYLSMKVLLLYRHKEKMGLVFERETVTIYM